MRKGLTLFAILALVLASAAFASNATDKIRPENVRPIGGSDEPATALAPFTPTVGHGPSSTLDLGVAYPAGTTYYDYQHNGTKSRMISTDPTGWVHMVWMNATTENHVTRHVFYNLWDPSSESFSIYPTGVQVDNRNRGGYTSQTITPDGRCYPVFHQVLIAGGHAHACASIDFLPQTGAFATFEPDYLIDSRCGTPLDMEILWPHMTLDIDGVLHMVSSESPCTGEAGDPQRFYYSRGLPVIQESGVADSINWLPVGPNNAEFLLIDTVMVIAPEIISSRNTSRLAMGWCKSKENLAHDSASQINNDVVYMLSEDGGLNWGERINITRFPDPDWDCASGDTVECQKDSFRVYTDISMLFDESDELHIAFTTANYFAMNFARSSGNNGAGTTYTFGYSQIWHWGEAYDEISPIRAVEVGYFPSPDTVTATWQDLGDWQRLLQHPSLCIDPLTGDLYAAYQLVDTVSWSEQGYPLADAWVSKSVDCGRSWSEGTNVSETIDGPATPAGQCRHERDITLSETVTYVGGVGYLHMEYILDRDGGEAVGETPTGTVTLNDAVYRRIPLTDIPATPRWDHTYPPIHVDHSQMPYGGEPNPDFTGPCGTAAGEDLGRNGIPGSFKLYQNYPNPFNPTTHIQFDLAKNMNVTLSVFNILGQEVATLLNNKAMTAGAQVIEFDATDLTSGVYIYQMKAGGLTQSHKMVLLK